MNKFMAFIKDEKGDTNIVSLIVLLVVIIVAVLVFRPYVAQLVERVMGLFA